MNTTQIKPAKKPISQQAKKLTSYIALFLISLLSLVAPASAITLEVPDISYTWYQSIYEEEKDLREYCVKELSNTDLMLFAARASCVDGQRTFPELFMVRVDSAGNEQWRKTVVGAGIIDRFPHKPKISLSPDGGEFYICGKDSNNYGLLMRVDTAGTLLWSRSLTEIAAYDTIRLSWDGSDSVTIFTMAQVGSMAEKGPVLIMADTSGSIRWHVPVDRDFFGYIQEVIPSTDTSTIVMGHHIDSPYDITLASVRHGDDTLWTNRTARFDIEDIQPVSDGGVIITGHGTGFSPEPTRMLLARFSAAGTKRYVKSYMIYEENVPKGQLQLNGCTGRAVSETNDGGFVVAGKGSGGGAGSIIHRVTEGGDAVFTDPSVGSSVGVGVIQMICGDYIFMGQGGGAFSCGALGFASLSLAKYPKSLENSPVLEPSLQPEIAVNGFTVERAGAGYRFQFARTLKNEKLNLYDINGRLMRTIKITGRSLEWDAKGFSNGVYVARLQVSAVMQKLLVVK